MWEYEKILKFLLTLCQVHISSSIKMRVLAHPRIRGELSDSKMCVHQKSGRLRKFGDRQRRGDYDIQIWKS